MQNNWIKEVLKEAKLNVKLLVFLFGVGEIRLWDIGLEYESIRCWSWANPILERDHGRLQDSGIIFRLNSQKTGEFENLVERLPKDYWGLHF